MSTRRKDVTDNQEYKAFGHILYWYGTIPKAQRDGWHHVAGELLANLPDVRVTNDPEAQTLAPSLFDGVEQPAMPETFGAGARARGNGSEPQ